MDTSYSILNKTAFISDAQRISGDLYYQHVDIVLALHCATPTKTNVAAFVNLSHRIKSVELVGQINESLYALYLSVPKGNLNRARTIQQSIKRFFAEAKKLDKMAYQFIQSSKIGISILGGDCVNFKMALTHAFQATMADGKQKRVSFFDSELQHEVRRQLLLEDVVKVALDNDDVNIVYQPIISTKTWEIDGYEILSRFPFDPILKTNTRELIEVCEDLNLISELDLLTYHKALIELKPIVDRGRAFLNINISANTRQDFSELFNCLNLLTKQSKLEHSRLVIDINPTRDTFDTAFEDGLQHLNLLTDNGVSIALADLSPGFDLGTQLAKGNYQYLRLDDRFYKKFHEEAEYFQVVKLMVKLCHDLNVKVIVEGVNDIEYARVLLFLGVDYLQGNAFTLPVSVKELPQLQTRIDQAVEQIFTSAESSNNQNGNDAPTHLGAIASSALPHLDPSDHVSLANQYFKTQSISVLPVVNEKQCVGIIERTRFNLFLTPTMGTDLETERESRTWSKPVNFLMQTEFNSVEASIEIKSLLGLLRDQTYQLPLVITRNGEYAGILAEKELIDYLLQRSV